MSDTANDIIIEQAKEMIDYWQGTVIEKMLRQDLAVQDLDSLSQHTREARQQIDDINKRLDEGKYGKS